MSAPDLPAARPVVDKAALVEVLAAHHGMGIVPTRCKCEQWELPKFSKPAGPQHARHVLDALLASGVLLDAADVRRAVATEIAAAIEDAASVASYVSPEEVTEALLHAARIAREAGERR